MEIGSTIKNYREKKHWSQNDLASKLFISRQAISKWENGNSLPSLDNIIAISEVLDVSLDELIKGDERVMNKIKNGSKWNIVLKTLAIALVAAIILYNIAAHLFHMSAGTAFGWFSWLALIAVVVLVLSLDFNNLQKAFNKVAYAALIILIVSALAPGIFEFMRGFWDGYADKVNGAFINLLQLLK